MADRLTPDQFRTLDFVARSPGGRTMLLPCHWRDRHHQSLIRRGFLRLRADPFRTRASMLFGRITRRGREAIAAAPAAVRAAARERADLDYARYVAACDAGNAP